MSAARFDLVKSFAIQNGGDYLLSLQFFNSSNEAVDAVGPLEFKLFNSPSGRGTPVYSVNLTLSTNTAELLIPESAVNALILRRCSYSIAQTTVPILGGYCDIIPLGTGEAQSTAPLRVTQNTNVVRITATNVLPSSGSSAAVLYTTQSLTSPQQVQACENINAATVTLLSSLSDTLMSALNAQALVADSLSNSTEIVNNEIRIKLNIGAGVGGSAAIRLQSYGEGVFVNSYDVLSHIEKSVNYAMSVTALSFNNINILTSPSTIGGVAITYSALLPTGDFPAFGDRVILSGQTVQTEDGLYQCRNTGLFKLTNGQSGNFYVRSGVNQKETWAVNLDQPYVKRISSPDHVQTLSAGAATTHTITHNKRTTRPQVKLFDTVTNEELFAQPSNISLNLFDLVLTALTNDVDVVVNIGAGS